MRGRPGSANTANYRLRSIRRPFKRITSLQDSMAADDPDNLANACIHCNRYKGPNIAGIDPETGELTRLFHPRTDVWNHHFSWSGAEILPLSAIGRVTASVLYMNDPEVLWLRETLAQEAAARSLRA